MWGHLWGPANGIGWGFRGNTPFLLSANELDFSDPYPDSFHLYRVFNLQAAATALCFERLPASM